MVFHRSAAALTSTACRAPITQAYRHRVKHDNLSLDKEQLSLASRLDTLFASLVSSERYLMPDEHLDAAARYYGGSQSANTSPIVSLLSSATNNFVGAATVAAHSLVRSSIILYPKGIYVYGSVGVGKSMLMDLFYTECKSIQRRRKRYHFHEFMLNVHQRIHSYKAQHPRADPIPPVAAIIAKEARLLCFDEMQITDIADAMIIRRLFTILFDLGVVVVTTSNRPPFALYEGGINRAQFLPFIDTLNERMTVIGMGSMHDYRRDKELESDAATLRSYVWPSSDQSSQQALEEWFFKGGGESRTDTIPVAMGRSVQVNRGNDACGWFSFQELCHQPLGTADYLAIADRFAIVIVDGVPQLGGSVYNESRRFVTLIDALYEAKTKLVIAADVSRDELFVGFDAEVETQDGDEEIALEDAIQHPRGDEESLVIGEGGSSSSSSTTLIRRKDGMDVEWSATGRIGVSLAQLSAVREVSFSFQRARSRLAEMAASSWGRQD